MSEIRVTRLFRYPVKALRGIELERCELERRGLSGDRRFMLVDEQARFVTQRASAELALFATELVADTLVIRHPAHGTLEIPRAPRGGERLVCEIWGGAVDARVEANGSAYFSRALARRLRLVYMSDEIERPVNPMRAASGDIVSFADGYPLLMANEGSLAALNAQLAAKVAIERFRPNVVIAGAHAWSEESWSRLTIGDAELRAPKPCERCSVINVDPITAARESEPLRTLTRIHAPAGQPLFGINLIPEPSSVGAILAVGDRVSAL
ncbi:MAG: MOSC domain-containing protein [Myxococcales bacterium]|nr:MOSC domain-containing protein [Myxococcales bacterium]